MKTLTFVLLWMIPVVGRAELAKPVRLVNEDLPHAAPVIGDVDGDGIHDLVVGVYRDDPYTGARIRWFRNIGTNTSAIYDRGEWLKADGADASVDEFCHTGASPQLVDFSGDGVPDLVSGSRECQLNVFTGIATHQFAAAKTFDYADAPLKRECRYNARLFLFDWDDDNDHDLLVTRMHKIWIVPNVGSTLKPKFGDPTELIARQKGQESFASSVVADWDGDGLLDLICGRWDGSIAFYRNESGDDNLPSRSLRPGDLGDPTELVGPALPRVVTVDQNKSVVQTARPAGHIRISVVDFDEDGDLDLIVGDAWVSQVARDQKAQPDEQAIASRKRAREKESELRRRLKELQIAPSDETVIQERNRVKQIETLTSECAVAWRQANTGASVIRHGSVWLIERK